jgi:hypothetical protein
MRWRRPNTSISGLFDLDRSVHAAGAAAADSGLTHAAAAAHRRCVTLPVGSCGECGVFLSQMLFPAGRAGKFARLRAAAHQLLKLSSTILAGVFKNRHNYSLGGFEIRLQQNYQKRRAEYCGRCFVTILRSATNNQQEWTEDPRQCFET